MCAHPPTPASAARLSNRTANGRRCATLFAVLLAALTATTLPAQGHDPHHEAPKHHAGEPGSHDGHTTAGHGSLDAGSHDAGHDDAGHHGNDHADGRATARHGTHDQLPDDPAPVGPHPNAAPPSFTSNDARERLIAGNRRFASGRTMTAAAHTPGLDHSRPFAAIVAPADSRMPPERVFDTQLGELVVVRNAGAVCDDSLLAGLEYAAGELTVPLIVVLAQEGCSAVEAAAATLPDPGRILPGKSDAYHELIGHFGPALRRAADDGLFGEALLARAERENAYATVRTALQRSALLRDRVRLGVLDIRAARLTSDGTVEWLVPRPAELDPRPAPDLEPGRREVRGVPPYVALDMLRGGHRRFLRAGASRADVTPERRARLARDGQRPFAAVLAGIDALAAPELVFDAGLGELWTVRSPGLALTPETIASLEIAVQEHGTALVTVLGDARSPFVARALQPGARAQFGRSLRQAAMQLDGAIAAAEHEHLSGEAYLRRVVELHALDVLRRLREASPVLREYESAGLVGVLAVVFDSATGELEWLPDPRTVSGFLAGVRPEPFVPTRREDDADWLEDLEDHGAFAALRREIREHQRGGPPVRMPRVPGQAHGQLERFEELVLDDPDGDHGHGHSTEEAAAEEQPTGLPYVAMFLALAATAIGLFLLRRFAPLGRVKADSDAAGEPSPQTAQASAPAGPAGVEGLDDDDDLEAFEEFDEEKAGKA